MHDGNQRAIDLLTEDHLLAGRLAVALRDLPDDASTELQENAWSLVDAFAERQHHARQDELILPALESLDEGFVGRSDELRRSYDACAEMADAMRLARAGEVTADRTLFVWSARSYGRRLERTLIDEERHLLPRLRDIPVEVEAHLLRRWRVRFPDHGEVCRTAERKIAAMVRVSDDAAPAAGEEIRPSPRPEFDAAPA